MKCICVHDPHLRIHIKNFSHNILHHNILKHKPQQHHTKVATWKYYCGCLHWSYRTAFQHRSLLVLTVPRQHVRQQNYEPKANTPVPYDYQLHLLERRFKIDLQCDYSWLLWFYFCLVWFRFQLGLPHGTLLLLLLLSWVHPVPLIFQYSMIPALTDSNHLMCVSSSAASLSRSSVSSRWKTIFNLLPFAICQSLPPIF